MTCREYHEYVMNGGVNQLTLSSTQEVRNATTAGTGSIYYHWERLVGAFLFNIEAAHTYASHLQGVVVDSNGNLIPEAALDLRLDVKSRLWQTNDNATHTMPRPESPYVDTQVSHLDVTGGVFNWAVTPSSQPHFANDGYAVKASASSKYSQTQNVVVANRMELIDGLEFVLPDAIKVHFDFGTTQRSDREVTIPFSTYVLDDSGYYSFKGDVDGPVYATVDGIPVNVLSLGGGDYVAVFTPEQDLGIDEGTFELVVDFEGGPEHSAFTDMIKFAFVTSKDVTSFTANLQGGNNGNLKFVVTITLSDGSAYDIEHAEKINAGQKGSKIFDYGDYRVSVAWNDNNKVTKCEIDKAPAPAPTPPKKNQNSQN